YEDSLFKVELSVEAFDRPKITPEVMALINDANVHILSITSRVHNYMAVMDITLEVEDIHELQVVMDKISSIPDVFQVRRQFSRKGQ
ncbi:MAG: ACT domain-containing protein, partial [Peptococcus niger]